MPKYRYRGINKAGDVLEGVINVSTQADVIQMLRER